MVGAELVDTGELVPLVATLVRPLVVDQHTVLCPGQAIPADAERNPNYTDRDLYVSEETAQALGEISAMEPSSGTSVMRIFEAWCVEESRVSRPCTTATYTEYGCHLMRRGLKVSTIRTYMSLIRTSMPAGKQPDNSLYLQLLADYQQKNKGASRKRQAFPITMQYLVPMMVKAEQDGRPIGIRDAALLAFGYRFLGRSSEGVNFSIEDILVLDDRIEVWPVSARTHNTGEPLKSLHDLPDLNLVARMHRWLAYLASQGVTTGPLFRHLQKNGKVATRTLATKRGDYLRNHAVTERVQHWFTAAGLVADERPMTSHSLHAGYSTDLAQAGATGQISEEEGP